jgi:hypothetical protein
VLLRPACLNDSLIGHRLPWDVYTASGVLVASAGTPVADRAQYAKLTARPLYRRPGEDGRNDDPSGRLTGLMQELPVLLRQAGTPDLEAGIRRLAGELMDLAHLDHDACLGLCRLTAMRDPAVRHCLITALVALELGEQAGLSETTLASLLGAALTMNLSAMRLHAELATGLARYNDEIHADIRLHPERGVRLLSVGGLADPVWLAAVAQHHENLDGSGYPRGLRDDAIIQPARILRIADYYAAKISGRRYRPPHSAKFALREIFAGERGRLDTRLAVLLLRRFGLYPPGTLVRLANREVAVAIRRQGHGDDAGNVVSFMEYRGRLLKTPQLRNTALAGYAVTGVTEPEPRWPDIPWARFWGY